MRCPRCPHDNPAGQKFCGECGARLASGCPSCGASNPPTQKFCGECGTALAQTDGPAKYWTPQSYTPKHLAEKILTSKAALEGERKQVTVLFADLKGSMELLADRDPEDARKILDPVLQRMMEAVHCYEGTVNQVMGDGIMALFGAPLAHEDHAVRACYAALRMQESVAQYAEGVFRSQGVPLQIRVGLNSGAVVVRAIGSEAVAGASRVAAFQVPVPSNNPMMAEAERAAVQLGLRLHMTDVQRPEDLPAAFQTAVRGGAQAIMSTQGPFFVLNRVRIAELALKHRLPSLSCEVTSAEAGTLLYYGPSIREGCRRAATYVDKILKGAKPADIPVEQPTKFELVINLKTAKALGLTIPPALLARADQVIE